MIRFKRLLLLLLVAVAVPFQGAQAAADGICMAFGHHDAPGQFADHEQVLAGSMDADSAGSEAEQGDAHCGPCVSCCGFASIAAPVVVPTVAIAPACAIQVHYAQGFARVLPGSLDRPPLAL
jgi:hypothetical protein